MTLSSRQHRAPVVHSRKYGRRYVSQVLIHPRIMQRRAIQLTNRLKLSHRGSQRAPRPRACVRRADAVFLAKTFAVVAVCAPVEPPMRAQLLAIAVV